MKLEYCPVCSVVYYKRDISRCAGCGLKLSPIPATETAPTEPTTAIAAHDIPKRVYAQIREGRLEWVFTNKDGVPFTPECYRTGEDIKKGSKCLLDNRGSESIWVMVVEHPPTTPPVLTDAQFIDDVIAVFRKHGKMLSSEDPYCGLDVSPLDERAIKDLDKFRELCARCGGPFKNGEDRIATVNRNGPVVLCRQCYIEAGNTVR